MKNKFKLLLLLLNSLSTSSALEVCNDSQVLIWQPNLPASTMQCAECNSLLHGCNKCHITDDHIKSVQCDICDWGLYLLQVHGKKDTAPE